MGGEMGNGGNLPCVFFSAGTWQHAPGSTSWHQEIAFTLAETANRFQTERKKKTPSSEKTSEYERRYLDTKPR